MRRIKWILTVALLLTATVASAQTEQEDEDAKYAATLLKAGTKAPDFSLTTIDGKNFRLKDLRGKIVVLDFWASWCPDCRKDAPKIAQLWREYGDKGVEFVGVSFDSDRKAWADCISRYQMSYTHVSKLNRWDKKQGVSKDYGVNWIPSICVIDRDGRVALSTVMTSKVRTKLAEMTKADLPVGGTREHLTLTGSKGKLDAIMQRPEGPTSAKTDLAIVCHGFTGNKEAELMQMLADSIVSHGMAALRFDFNGHGKSEGEFVDMTVPNETEDLKQVCRYARQLPWVNRIYLVGHSQGGVVVAMTAGEMGPDTISRVALLAPAGVLRDDAIRGNVFGKMYKESPLDPPAYVTLPYGKLRLGRNYIVTAFSLPIYETAARWQGPSLVIHGNGDRVVPYTYGERFAKQWASSELVIPYAFDHGFTQNIRYVAQLVSRFLAK